MKFVFYAPKVFEPWDYKNPMEQGIGGSETAHVEMAIRLAERGHEVISYSPKPTKQEELYNSVKWRHIDTCNFRDRGIWVVSRYPEIADNFSENHLYQKLWLVMQDVTYPKLNEERLEKFDLLLPLCSSHYNFTLNKYPQMKDKIVQSSNGIRSEYLSTLQKVERNPYRLMFASSPDRGLAPLLKIFPKAKEYIPELELHIYYGFNNLDKIVNNKVLVGAEQVSKKDLLKMMKQDGIFYHGRLGQKELYLEWLKSGIWCHPSALFCETSCITSMDAQALGAMPITCPLWALDDNVKYGYLIEGYPWGDDAVMMRYVHAIVNMCINKTVYDEQRDEMMIYARERFSWEKVVDQYIMLGGLIRYGI